MNIISIYRNNCKILCKTVKSPPPALRFLLSQIAVNSVIILKNNTILLKEKKSN